jgi:hypothetical protein
MRPALASFLRNPPAFTALSRGAPRPSAVAHVQTDGSFTPSLARTAVILRTTAATEYTLAKSYFDHRSCTHTEWCSVLDGIKYAVKKGDGSMELENDCLGVVKALIRRQAPTERQSAHFYSAVCREIRGLDYFGIRWIPREMNKADDLFRLG